MDVKSAIDRVIEKIGFQPFSDEQASYDLVMFVLVVVSMHRINPDHNQDFEKKCEYSNRMRLFFPPTKSKRKKAIWPHETSTHIQRERMQACAQTH